jgi:hypothetical protein
LYVIEGSNEAALGRKMTASGKEQKLVKTLLLD